MAGRKPTTGEVRFAEKCKPVESGCIEWTSGRNRWGYGLFHADGRMQAAHRWAFEQAHGKQPLGIDICHTCDVRHCVNLQHLFPGTRKENMQDAVRKGRTSHVARNSGETHPMARLNATEVIQIREWHAAGWPMRDLSNTYDVSFAQVSRIIHNQAWKHL